MVGGPWLGPPLDPRSPPRCPRHRFLEPKAAMRSGSRGRPRPRLGDRGVMAPSSPLKRRLLPRAQLLPLLLLALALGSAFYTLWSGWHRRTEALPRGQELRVRPGAPWHPEGPLGPTSSFGLTWRDPGPLAAGSHQLGPWRAVPSPGALRLQQWLLFSPNPLERTGLGSPGWGVLGSKPERQAYGSVSPWALISLSVVGQAAGWAGRDFDLGNLRCALEEARL